MKKNIAVGIASSGMSGRISHGPLLAHHKDFHIKRIVQRSKNDALATYPNVIISRSVDELLDDDEIELVVVNTPDDTHFDFARKSLEGESMLSWKSRSRKPLNRRRSWCALLHA